MSSCIHMVVNGFRLLSVGWMLGVIGFLLPVMDVAASPRAMFQEVSASLPNPDDPICVYQHWDWRGDEDLYYWRYWHTGVGIIGWQKDFAQVSKDFREMVDQKC
ncbi:MAG: hypothetical protein IH978_06760 [Nitrospinae bacterium]|nr:hypothetical protein [Nitrospinota bacterium]